MEMKLNYSSIHVNLHKMELLTKEIRFRIKHKPKVITDNNDNLSFYLENIMSTHVCPL